MHLIGNYNRSKRDKAIKHIFERFLNGSIEILIVTLTTSDSNSKSRIFHIEFYKPVKTVNKLTYTIIKFETVLIINI